MHKIETKLQTLAKKKQKLEQDWISQAWSELSAEEINDKLEQVRTTPQTNDFLQLIQQAHNAVLSKETKIAEAKSYLETMRSELNKLGDERKDLIMQKDRTVTQVFVLIKPSSIQVQSCVCLFASMSVLRVISNQKSRPHRLTKHQSSHHHMQCMCDVCHHCALVPFADREHGNAAERNAPEGGAAGSRFHQIDGGIIVA